MTALFQDVKFGTRILAKSPGLCAVVVLTTAFGAGLNGAVFLQFNDSFLRPPDLRNPETLVWLDDGDPRTGGTTYPDYLDYHDRVAAIDLAVFARGDKTSAPVLEGRPLLAGSAPAQPVEIGLASGNYFRVLQAPAALGRTFGPSDDLPPLGTSVAVLSDGYWARQYGRAPDVLGRTINLNLKPFTIVGVMTPGFGGARPPGSRGSTPDVWVPIGSHPVLEPGSDLLRRRTMWWGLRAIGRLREGVEIPQARAQVATVAAALDAEYPGQRRPRAPSVWRVTDFDSRVLRGQEVAMLGMAAAATLLFSGSSDEEVVINESLATRLWPEGDRLGKRLTTGEFARRRSHIVVGVVRDAPYAELRHEHESFLLRPARAGTILIRTSVPAATVMRSATAAVKQLDARLTVTAARPAERVAEEREGNRRTIAAVAGIGGLALLIALVNQRRLKRSLRSSRDVRAPWRVARRR